MKTITGQDVIAMLTELHDYYYKTAKTFDRDTDHPAENYAIGKIDGALDVIGCILFNVLGGEKYTEFLGDHTGLDLTHKNGVIVPFKRKEDGE